MKHHFGFARIENVLNGFCIADVSKHRLRSVQESATVDGELHFMKSAFITIQHDEFGWVKTR
jgi:hypothetical protein